MRLLVYEHVAGGGCADEPISPSILCEGFAMLRAVISDFKSAGHHVTTTLDMRIARLNPPLEADCIMPISSSQEAHVAVRKMSELADASYIIAPETNQTLQSIVETMEQAGVASLNCPARTIEKVVDKIVLYKALKKLGVPTPETVMFSVNETVEEIKQAIQGALSYPLIFKPLQGVGCCGLSAVRNKSQVAAAISKIRKESTGTHFVAQELIKGTATSVSLVSTGIEALGISLNRQDVTIGAPSAPSSYNGGLVPFDSPLRAEAFAAAEKTIKSFQNLKGYVGVDLVLTGEEAVVVEVNPRLTMSYIGLRRVANFNVAQAIINAVLKGELPANVENEGYAYFSKIETSQPTIDVLQKTYRLKDIAAPPFPVSANGKACALITSHGATLNQTMSRFRAAKKRLISIIGGGSNID